MFNIYGKYTDATIYSDICEPSALSLIYDLCNHPVFKDASIKIMPDVHSGAGCAVGTTIKMKGGRVIPSIVGADIGCGVLTVIFEHDGEIDFKSLDEYIDSSIPYGMAIHSTVHKGMSNEVKRKISSLCEELGMYRSYQPFVRSCGTLGGGNHYIEIGLLENGKYALTIHTGSRGLGKCIAEYFGDVAKNYLHSNNITGVNRSLPYVEGDDYDSYVRAMLVAAEMARESRRLIASDILSFLGAKTIDSFDTMHNYIELHRDGSITIRKGAIRAAEGERVAIPLNMRDGVLICVGRGNPDWNCSAPHGAGRLMSRSEAKSSISMEEYEVAMKGISSWSVVPSTIDESPMAYKPASMIREQISDTADILYTVRPVYNFKARSFSGR